MHQFKGTFDGEGKKIAIVVSSFNEMISKQLLDGCVQTLAKCKVSDDAITVFWTPGAFEIPVIAKKTAASKQFDGVICLGAVIRGDTPHFDYVCTAASRGIAEAAYESGKPVIFGILTTDTQEQAMNRAGIKGGNKGADAALAALEMANLLVQVK